MKARTKYFLPVLNSGIPHHYLTYVITNVKETPKKGIFGKVPELGQSTLGGKRYA